MPHEYHRKDAVTPSPSVGLRGTMVVEFDHEYFDDDDGDDDDSEA